MAAEVDVFGSSPDSDVFQDATAKADARYKWYVAHHGRSCEERTQLAADRLFQGPIRFRVFIPGDRAQPSVVIRAHSDAEAVGFYTRLCGIISCDWPIKAVIETDDGPPAPAPQPPGRQPGQRYDPLRELHGD